MFKCLLALSLFAVPFLLKSQPSISFAPVVSGLSQPVDAVEVNDSTHRLFIVERGGDIRIWNGISLSSTPFINIASLITAANQEQGLLSMAFHPQYAANGFFFVYYTNTSGAVTIARYTRLNADLADASSGVILMTIPKRFVNHNGGKLAFGTDGYLYFGTGDGGSGGDPDNNAQNASSLLGKMLRIDVNSSTPPYYNIPADNPFAGSTTLRQEIIATGLRNPWRWSFDKQTGDVWIADVGQDLWEEVNTVPAATRLNRNYGWSCLEGTHVFKTSCTAQPNNVTPIFEYPHNSANGGYSITGGYVYHGAEFPSLQGYYVFADYVTGNLWLTKPDGNGGWITTMQANQLNSICSFSEGNDGTLYAITLTGTIYKVIANNTLPVHLVSFAGAVSGNKYLIKWSVQNEEAGDQYVLESSTGLYAGFKELTRLKSSLHKEADDYSIKVALPSVKTYFRLAVISVNQQKYYSSVIAVDVKQKAPFSALLKGKDLFLELPQGTTYVELADVAGKLLKRQKISSAPANMTISLIDASRGIITIKALVNGQWQAVRVLY